MNNSSKKKSGWSTKVMITRGGKLGIMLWSVIPGIISTILGIMLNNFSKQTYLNNLEKVHGDIRQLYEWQIYDPVEDIKAIIVMTIIAVIAGMIIGIIRALFAGAFIVKKVPVKAKKESQKAKHAKSKDDIIAFDKKSENERYNWN